MNGRKGCFLWWMYGKWKYICMITLPMDLVGTWYGSNLMECQWSLVGYELYHQLYLVYQPHKKITARNLHQECCTFRQPREGAWNVGMLSIFFRGKKEEAFKRKHMVCILGFLLRGLSQDLFQWLGSPPLISAMNGHVRKGNNPILRELTNQGY